MLEFVKGRLLCMWSGFTRFIWSLVRPQPKTHGTTCSTLRVMLASLFITVTVLALNSMGVPALKHMHAGAQTRKMRTKFSTNDEWMSFDTVARVAHVNSDRFELSVCHGKKPSRRRIQHYNCPESLFACWVYIYRDLSKQSRWKLLRLVRGSWFESVARFSKQSLKVILGREAFGV